MRGNLRDKGWVVRKVDLMDKMKVLWLVAVLVDQKACLKVSSWAGRLVLLLVDMKAMKLVV